MNRIIKFRVWDTQLNLWVNNIGMSKNNILTHGDEKRFHVMQFTGLQDKNGVDIYEGDICRYDNGVHMSRWVDGETFVVVGLPGRFAARMRPFDAYDGNNQNTMNEQFQDCVTVIGNIYEHPQLLTPAV